MHDLSVRMLSPNEAVHLDEPLHSAGGFTALDAWSLFLRDHYGYQPYRIETFENDRMTGILVLSHVRHPVFGNYLTTAPFASYGGFAFESSDARDVLLAEARSIAQKLKVEYVVVRFDEAQSAPPDHWIQQPIYCTYLLDLPREPDLLFPQFSPDHRNHVRKSLKKGFKIKFGHLDLLDDAYEGLARSMHELGSPYHSKSYLRAMAGSLGEALEFAVIYDVNERLVGAGVFILHNDVASNLHANILRNFRQDYAGEFFYWSVISRYCRKGFRVFDMGRSLIGSGNEVFKMKWKPRKRTLSYWYSIDKGHELPGLNQKNPKFRFAIWAWKLLPAFVVRPLGPSLIRGLA